MFLFNTGLTYMYWSGPSSGPCGSPWVTRFFASCFCFSAVIGEIDEETDSTLDLGNIRAEPLNSVVHWPFSTCSAVATVAMATNNGRTPLCWFVMFLCDQRGKSDLFSAESPSSSDVCGFFIYKWFVRCWICFPAVQQEKFWINFHFLCLIWSPVRFLFLWYKDPFYKLRKTRYHTKNKSI